MKKLIFVTIILILSFVSEVTAQEPGDTLWTECYGGPGSDKGSEVQLTSDGGYIITGRTGSFGAGAQDAYLIRIDANGDTLWTKTYGGVDWDYAYSVKQTTDDGFIVVGGSKSFSSGGDYDVYLIKTDADGDTLWTRTYGGTDIEYGSSVQLTSDGGYIIIGVTMSFGAGDRDFYLLKTDANGDILWTQTYGGTDSDEGYSVQLTSDGGYILVGETCSYGVPAGTADVWLIKTDADGTSLWSQTYGGAYTDFGSSVQLTSDGGYIIAAGTWSYGAGNTDAYLIKTDADGNSLWTQTYGNTMYDTAYSIQQTADGGYIFTGDYGYADYTNDVWIVKTDVSGNIIWEETYGEAGGWNYDMGASIQIASDNNYIIAGQTYSYGAGDWDVWVLKIAGEGTTPLNPPQNLFVDETGYATWDAPENNRDLLGYNIYLDGVSVDFTTDLFYQYTGLVNGQSYLSEITADYDEGESDPIDFIYTYIEEVFDPPSNVAVDPELGKVTWLPPGVVFLDDFESYTVGEYLAVQSADWTTWTNAPGGAEDALISDVQALNGNNSVVVEGSSDLVLIMNDYTSGVYSMELNLFVPTGYCGYWNLQKTSTPGQEWGFQIMFDVTGIASADAGATAALTFPFSFDTWINMELIVDLDADWCKIWVDGVMLYEYQWTLGCFGTPGLLSFGGMNLYAWASGGNNPLCYFDDIELKEITSETRDLIGYNIYLNDMGTVLATVGADVFEYQYIDLVNGEDYIAGVSAVYDAGESEIVQYPFTYTGVGAGNIVNITTALKGNYPNPFNPTTTIKFTTTSTVNTEIVIYNIKGQKVKSLVNERFDAGSHKVVWSGKDENGKSVTSGIYFYKMNSGKFTSTKKMILLK